MARNEPDPAYLRGLVDMGSNGIRFSISDLSPPTARVIPTLYQSRTAISLYDAQYTPTSSERRPIPDNVIHAVVTSLLQFKITCADFKVPKENITLLATEATRTAINTAEFQRAIKGATGWDVTLLAREDEGRVGAMGVASSLGEVKGLMMDLGGGSTQLTWLISHGEQGGLQMPAEGAASMPFGAAALMRRLGECEGEGKGARDRFADEIRSRVKEAYTSLRVPRELEDVARREGGFDLYLSGGGFRGWGFVLMSRHPVTPYPIPIINGFSANRTDFLNTAAVQTTINDQDSSDEAIFRVSDRRASQVPAVAFLVTALSQALPQIKTVRFCQGGVREGHLYSQLAPSTQRLSPLIAATRPLATSSAETIRTLLLTALPPSSDHHTPSPSPFQTFIPTLISALANTISTHSTYAKDIRPSAALHYTTTGHLASVHGLSHSERALLSLLLCERWGGAKDLPPSDCDFHARLCALLAREEVWALSYLGRVAALVGEVYPAGRVVGERVRFGARWVAGEKKGRVGVGLEVGFLGEGGEEGIRAQREMYAEAMERIVKVGKKKNWIGGKEGVGWKVEVAARAV